MAGAMIRYAKARSLEAVDSAPRAPVRLVRSQSRKLTRSLTAETEPGPMATEEEVEQELQQDVEDQLPPALGEDIRAWSHSRVAIYALWNQGDVSAKLRQLNHIISRLHILEANVTNSPNRGSELWTVLHTLHRVHLEFGAARGFGRRIMGCFDADVRRTIRDHFIDGNNIVNNSPWTRIGNQHVKDYMAHLRSLSARDPDFKQYECNTVVQGLDLLRKYDHSLTHISNEARRRSNHNEMDDLQELIEKKVLGSKGCSWWAQGPLCRAFAIGIKDLLVKKDYKALTFVFASAGACVVPHLDEELEEGSEPFWWVSPFLTLAGPHIAKFAGDSESVREFGRGLKLVQDQTLPRFLGQLSELRSVLEGWIDMTTQLKTALLGAAVAMGPVIARRYLVDAYCCCAV